MLWMTDREIIGHVRRNGGGYHNLIVLAELNCCRIKEIEEVLERNGGRKKSGVWVCDYPKPKEYKFDKSKLEKLQIEREERIAKLPYATFVRHIDI